MEDRRQIRLYVCKNRLSRPKNELELIHYASLLHCAPLLHICTFALGTMRHVRDYLWLFLASHYILVSGFVIRCHPRANPKPWPCNQVKNPFVVVMDTDSAIDSIEQRASLGIMAALEAWPYLKDRNEDLLKDPTWLRNKLLALAHVLTDTWEFAIAARLLLEEQELDQGESNNKRGKYASKYHPQGMDSNATVANVKSSSSRRPLTVGELSANWETSLLETLQLKYHCNYSDPMPFLQKLIEERLDEIQGLSMPTLHRELSHIASSPRFQNSRLIVTATPSDQKMVEGALKRDKINYVVASSPSQALEDLISSPDHKEVSFRDDQLGPTIIVLKNEKTAPEIILDLLQQTEHEILVVVESSWKRLESKTNLFGDSIPRIDNIGNSIVQNARLSLNLAGWTKLNPTQTAQATMSPWTDIIGWEKMEKLLLPSQLDDAFQ